MCFLLIITPGGSTEKSEKVKKKTTFKWGAKQQKSIEQTLTLLEMFTLDTK